MEHIHSKDITLIENFLPDDVIEEFEELHKSPDFPWYLNKVSTGIENYRDDKNIKETCQLCHSTVVNTEINSNFFNRMKIITFYLESVIDKKIKEFIRIKHSIL